MTKEVPMTEEQQQQWIKNQYQVATKYLAEKGVVTQSVQVEESRYLVPILALWKLTSIDGNKFWVLCGDLPSDHSSVDVAPNAREALRHFSLKWQMQAENLLQAKNEEQNEFAHLLIGRADGLYKLFNDESLWQAN
ncbi:DUF4826 family protein [Colwellia psychrerythraea]|uniref:DUF4826 domain-containing protein n=1 Tax=Colwellia psychrerythraea TaxID=28229 RepID=A0A099KH44_COLPS|nr:DUF4826 family protein [Colwellia psychrerythraea]KGJ89575.1 hypothetical protein ND2E_3766 [Colwellia psychrerythraea]